MLKGVEGAKKAKLSEHYDNLKNQLAEFIEENLTIALVGTAGVGKTEMANKIAAPEEFLREHGVHHSQVCSKQNSVTYPSSHCRCYHNHHHHLLVASPSLLLRWVAFHVEVSLGMATYRRQRSPSVIAMILRLEWRLSFVMKCNSMRERQPTFSTPVNHIQKESSKQGCCLKAHHLNIWLKYATDINPWPQRTLIIALL